MSRPVLFAIMALAAAGALGAPGAQSVWQDRPRPKTRPHVKRMIAGTDAEINAWNEAVELRKAIKMGAKP